jgi:hypothetical protein
VICRSATNVRNALATSVVGQWEENTEMKPLNNIMVDSINQKTSFKSFKRGFFMFFK